MTYRRLVIAALLVVCVGTAGKAFQRQPPLPSSPPVPQLRWMLLPGRPLNPEGFSLLTYRAAVPGGWLVAVLGRVEPTGTSQPFKPGDAPVGVSFVPDPDH